VSAVGSISPITAILGAPVMEQSIAISNAQNTYGDRLHAFKFRVALDRLAGSRDISA